MRVSTTLLSVAIATTTTNNVAFSQEVTVIDTSGISPISENDSNIPEYSAEQCTSWLERTFAADSDGSGGLSEDEFHDFLTSIQRPPNVVEYFANKTSFEELEFIFKIVHKSLACQCHALGLGEDCCEGDNAEIPIGVVMSNSGVDSSNAAAVDEFRTTLCNNIAASFGEHIDEFQFTVGTGGEDEEEDTTDAGESDGGETLTIDIVGTAEDPDTGECIDADEIMTNMGDNDVLSHVIQGFGQVANDILALMGGVTAETRSIVLPDSRRALRSKTLSQKRNLQKLQPVEVTDIDCPDNIDSECCVNFQVVIDTGDMSAEDIAAFEEAISTAIEEGGLFDAIKENYPDTNLGSIGGDQTEDETETEMKGLELDIVGSAWDLESLAAGDNPVARYDAKEVAENTDENDILSNLIKGFGLLSTQILLSGLDMSGSTAEGKRRGLRSSFKQQRKMQNLEPVEVTDIACPEDIVYTPPDGVTCLNFHLMIDSDNLTTEMVASFEEQVNAAISNGELYDIILTEYPQTNITGLGNPGKGYDYVTESVVGGEDSGASVDKSTGTDTEEDAGGLSTAAIVFIILAVIVVPIAVIAMFSRYRKVQEEERLASLREYQEKNPDADLNPMAARAASARAVRNDSDDSHIGSVYSQDQSFLETGEDPKMTAGSALAAMGAAGATAAALSSPKASDDDAIKEEIRQLVEETNAPKSADELLAAYAGREGELLKNLRKMKAKQDKDASIKAEVVQLIEDTNSPKSAEELLAAYKGREDELLTNLRKMKAKQMSNEEKEAMKVEVAQLVKDTNAPKSSEELLQVYAGREEELLKNLRKMKAKQENDANIKAEIETLVKEVNAPKTAEEMLASYSGREEELLKNLRKMKAKQERASLKATEKDSLRNQIEELVKDTSPGKSASELMDAYEGREAELVGHLAKLKNSKKNIV